MYCIWEGKYVTDWQTEWGIPLLEVHESLSSTNSRARELLQGGAPSFSAIVAETQTQGRGRNGRYWYSPKGMGLWMSFVLRDAAPSSTSLVPILAGLAVLDALESVCGNLGLGIKWPNDIEIDGRKVGGILCEVFDKDSLMVGIGINLKQKQDDLQSQMLDSATSLFIATGRVLSTASVMGPIIKQCKNLLEPLPTMLSKDLVEKLEKKSTVMGLRVLLANGLEGSVVGFSSMGAMIVMAEGVLHHINSSGAVRCYAKDFSEETKRK